MTSGVALLADRLPAPAVLIRWTQSLAVLDAVMSPDWELRYFSFDASWSHDQQLASMRNGQGDDWSITFGPAGTFLRGFDHECSLSPFASQPPRVDPRLLAGLPAVLRPAADEVAFTLDDVPLLTMALWRLTGDDSWSYPGDVDHDGGTWLFAGLDGEAETYRHFAREYYECDVSADAVRHVFDHRPLTEPVVATLNHETTLAELADDLAQIGYPT